MEITIWGFGFSDISPMIENGMESNMEHEIDTGMTYLEGRGDSASRFIMGIIGVII